MIFSSMHMYVIPAEAGIQEERALTVHLWIPAYAGMTIQDRIAPRGDKTWQ